MYHIRPHLTRHENRLYFLFPCAGNSSLNFKHSISRHLGVGSSAVSDEILGGGGSYVDIADKKRSEFAQVARHRKKHPNCLLYTSDAADDMQCVDLGGRRIIKK